MLDRNAGSPATSGWDLSSESGESADAPPLDTPRLTTSEQLGLGPEVPFSVADRIGLVAERVDEWRQRPLLVAGVVVGLVALAVGLPRLTSSEPDVAIEDRIPQVTLVPDSTPPGAATVFVHVSGAVRSPGVYVLESTARVIDAVDAAGGATGEAQLHELNLAAMVVDGQQIRVPVEGESVVPESVGGTGPVDLNSADVIGLQALPGVGPATAEAIVAHREENGPFRTVDDLLDVPGIGPSKLAAIADAAMVR